MLTSRSPPARYALTRLPDNLASLPLSQALLDLVASASERKHVKVYTRAESLFNLVSEPDFFDAKLASVIAEMVTTFVGEWDAAIHIRIAEDHIRRVLPQQNICTFIEGIHLFIAASCANLPWNEYRPTASRCVTVGVLQTYQLIILYSRRKERVVLRFIRSRPVPKYHSKYSQPWDQRYGLFVRLQ